MNHQSMNAARRMTSSVLARFCVAAILMACLYESSPAATSVTRFGITWTFSQDKTVGQYANGDWWVVGPVTITSISPASTTVSGWTRNGTMVNPVPSTVSTSQGFDSSIAKYAYWDPALNVAPSFKGSALVVAAGSSVVSTISVDNTNVNTSYAQTQEAEVLTVVASAPVAGSFRPSPVGTNKAMTWNKSNLNYGILQSLAPTASTPALASVAGLFEKPWLVMHEGNSVQVMSPKNMPNYGRDAAQQLSLGLLSLHLNYTNAQKETLYIHLVQYGLDVYGSLRAGMDFRGAGGLNNGRKAAMVLAGLALNDANVLEWSNAAKHMVFAEDKQTFYVTQSDVGRVMYTADGRPRETYTQAMVGLPEWGEQHYAAPQYDASNWGSAYYRWVGGAQLGNVLALRLTGGGMAAWNWPALFAYTDRYWEIESSAGQTNQSWSSPNNISPFVFEMCTYYRSGGGGTPPPPPATVTFAVGDRIELSATTNVRATASLTGTLLGTQASGALGSIVGGSVIADNVTWWQVNFDTGVDGWCGVDNMLQSSSPQPPTTVTFAIGDRVATIRNTNVRATATLTGTLLGTQDTGAIGTIVAGPTTMDSVIWWQVNYDTGADGWSGEDNFSKLAGTPPTAPKGLKVVPP